MFAPYKHLIKNLSISENGDLPQILDTDRNQNIDQNDLIGSQIFIIKKMENRFRRDQNMDMWFLPERDEQNARTSLKKG